MQLLYDNRSSNINYYSLRLVETHAYEVENKASTQDSDI